MAAIHKELESVRTIRVAIYMRLSKEDAASGESGSIRTQRQMLRRFVEENFGAYCLSEFCDDGYSGTNLQRPGIAAMLEQAEACALDCIIVKDFSRFSRDYIVLGDYLDKIFPFLGIRFISVNDQYDSEKCSIGEMEAAFLGLLYDFYSKDLSVKVKSALAVNKDKGKYVSAHCPFGYQKALHDRHMLVIAKDEAAVVRRIFNMAASGDSSCKIARILNTEGIKTPLQWRIEKGTAHKKKKAGKSFWNSASVCRILHNEAYVGDYVFGKYEKEYVGGKTRTKPKEEWKTIASHHEPIVSRELFHAAQAAIRMPARRNDKACPGKQNQAEAVRHPLAGMLQCAYCGRILQLRKGKNPYFYCPNRHALPAADSPGLQREDEAACPDSHTQKGIPDLSPLYVKAGYGLADGRAGLQDACVKKINAAYLEQVVLYEIYKQTHKFAKDGLTKELVCQSIERIIVYNESHVKVLTRQQGAGQVLESIGLLDSEIN